MRITAPVPGTVLRILVNEGQRIEKDDPVVILQSMKTEVSISTDSGGKVKAVLVKEGDELEMGAIIAEVE